MRRMLLTEADREEISRSRPAWDARAARPTDAETSRLNCYHRPNRRGIGIRLFGAPCQLRLATLHTYVAGTDGIEHLC